MAKVQTSDGAGVGNKRVVPVEWHEAVPFALKLEERWRHVNPAMPERIRYVELDVGLPGPRDAGELYRPGDNGQNSRTDGGNDRTILPAFLPYGDDDD
jgi:hypothetical protein